jgi:hypothetical protein
MHPARSGARTCFDAERSRLAATNGRTIDHRRQDGARRSNTMSIVRLKASQIVFVAMLMLGSTARAQDVVCPGGLCTGVDPSPSPSEYVSPPDMALQIEFCLPSTSSAAGAFITPLRDAIASAMQELDVNHDDPPPNPEVRHACVGGKSTFGAWLQPIGSYGLTDTATARNVGLSRVNLVGNLDPIKLEFAFQFRPIGIARLVAIRWRDQPLRVNDDGDADPNGRIHLDGYNVFFDNDSDYYGRRIVDLAISGSYDYIQSTDFTLHVYDFLTLSALGQPQCETSARADATETTVDTVLGSLTGGAGGPMDDVVGEGPGCKIAKRLPRTVLVARPKDSTDTPKKIVFTYTRINSYQTSGLIFGGTFEVLDRQPYVAVQGPVSILAEPNQSFRGTFTAYPTDLRGPYTVSWTSLGATPITGSSAHATITWSLPTLAIGSQAPRMLSVKVTDADGLRATGYKSVILKRVLDSEPVSTTCVAKPWLCP